VLDDLRQEVVVGSDIIRGKGHKVKSGETVLGQLQRLVQQLWIKSAGIKQTSDRE